MASRCRARRRCRSSPPRAWPRRCTCSPLAAAIRAADVSGSHADDPAAEAHVAVQARPGEVASVPATRVADVDAARVVADAHEPVTLAEPACTVHQQGTL